VVVACPADNPPLIRLHGAWLATSIAEYFRERGLSVLLIMDSLTRFAQAQREIGLAIGEAPATKGYPPSVFARLPALVERAGNGASGRGSITAFYTVLTEGDDQQDPIADSARAISTATWCCHAASPRRAVSAVDIEASVSRVMQEIIPHEHAELARRFRQTLAIYQQHRDLINIGAYQRGSDPRIDAAIELWPAMQKFLMQPIEQRVSHADAVGALRQLFASVPPGKAA
jgi:flagellum-specific ATP synthase